MSDVYSIGSLPPIGEVPSKMFAQVVRQDRFGDPRTAFQIEAIDVPEIKPHEVLIGRKLAEKLGVGLGDKVVGMASTVHGNVGSDLFRVVGIFETVSSEFDKAYMYISLPNAQEMLEMDGRISEFAIVTDDVERVDAVRDDLRAALGDDLETLS